MRTYPKGKQTCTGRGQTVKLLKVWLASQSERRASMLEPLFSDLECRGFSNVDETPSPGTVDVKVLSICKKKAAAVPKNTHLTW